jgi:hypothetical protein
MISEPLWRVSGLARGSKVMCWGMLRAVEESRCLDGVYGECISASIVGCGELELIVLIS